MPQDPYAAIAKPVADPYADLANGGAVSKAAPNNSQSFSDAFGYAKSKGPSDEQLVQSYDQSHPILGKLARFATSAGDTAMSIPSALYHMAADPATAEEKKDFPHQIPGEITMSRLVGAEPAANAGADYIRGKVPSVGAAASVLPEAMGQGVGNVAGSAFLPKTAELGVKSLGAGAGLVKDAAKASGIGLSPIEKLVKAAGPSVRDANFPQALETAAPELARQHAATPVKTVQGVADAAHTGADALWKSEIEPQITRNATETIDGGAIGKQIRAGIDPGMTDLFPEQAKAANSFADKFEGPLALDKANTYLKTLNAQLKGFYKMSPEGRAAAGVTDGRISSMESAADGLRQQMYDKLDSLGETDPAGLRKQYGALKQVQDVFRKRAIVAGRQAPLNLPQVLSLAGGAGEAAGALMSGHPAAALGGVAAAAVPTILKLLNSPDALAARGVKGLALPEAAPFQLKPSGTLPGPVQQILNLSGGENIPGVDLKLTSPGDMPPDAQRPLSFMDSPNPNQSGPVAPGGVGTAPTSSVPRSLGAAAAAPAAEEVPGVLRGATGLDRRATPRSAPMSATDLEAAIKQRKPVQTPFDVTDNAMKTIMRDPDMQKISQDFGQGGHAGNSVSSLEELNRPGKNYVVSQHGKLTYHGKAFAPENTPEGAAHVTVLPDGQLRVNAGNLTPTMESALKNGIKQ